MSETPAVADLIPYAVTAASGISTVDTDETVPMVVAASDPETGIYSGYVFLPGNGGMQYVTVDPTVPEPAPAPASGSGPSLADLVAEVKGDSEFVEFLAWKDAQKSQASNPTPAPTEPTPAPTEPTSAPTEPTPAPTEPTPAPTDPGTVTPGPSNAPTFTPPASN